MTRLEEMEIYLKKMYEKFKEKNKYIFYTKWINLDERELTDEIYSICNEPEDFNLCPTPGFLHIFNTHDFTNSRLSRYFKIKAYLGFDYEHYLPVIKPLYDFIKENEKFFNECKFRNYAANDCVVFRFFDLGTIDLILNFLEEHPEINQNSTTNLNPFIPRINNLLLVSDYNQGSYNGFISKIIEQYFIYCIENSIDISIKNLTDFIQNKKELYIEKIEDNCDDFFYILLSLLNGIPDKEIIKEVIYKPLEIAKIVDKIDEESFNENLFKFKIYQYKNTLNEQNLKDFNKYYVLDLSETEEKNFSYFNKMYNKFYSIISKLSTYPNNYDIDNQFYEEISIFEEKEKTTLAKMFSILKNYINFINNPELKNEMINYIYTEEYSKLCSYIFTESFKFEERKKQLDENTISFFLDEISEKEFYSKYREHLDTLNWLRPSLESLTMARDNLLKVLQSMIDYYEDGTPEKKTFIENYNKTKEEYKQAIDTFDKAEEEKKHKENLDIEAKNYIEEEKNKLTSLNLKIEELKKLQLKDILELATNQIITDILFSKSIEKTPKF